MKLLCEYKSAGKISYGYKNLVKLVVKIINTKSPLLARVSILHIKFCYFNFKRVTGIPMYF